MSDLSYSIVWNICAPAFWTSSRPLILHRERADRAGAYILAGNHRSPYDVPLMMYTCPRKVDFLSIVEMQRKPFVRFVYDNANVMYIDRSRPSPGVVKAMVDRLLKGRVVAMFPEATIRTEETAAINGGKIRKGIGKIAQLGKAPIVPVVLINSGVYAKPLSWLPHWSTRWGVNFGEPIFPPTDIPEEQVPDAMEEAMVQSWKKLYAELSEAFSKW